MKKCINATVNTSQHLFNWRIFQLLGLVTTQKISKVFAVCKLNSKSIKKDFPRSEVFVLKQR